MTSRDQGLGVRGSIRRGETMNRSRQFGRHAQRSKLCSSRVGFTLVEMLVAVTLVLLMMVMFGEIFQIATGSVTKQRIMADNDQNVRTFISVIRADLDKRTFRTLIPYFPGELSSNPGTPFEKRRGYFYISNNNLADGTDDVLQFTVDSTVNLGNADESPYFGHAVPLSVGGASGFLTNPNQPDRDDNQIISNNAGSSKAAELSYFLRGGKLYRRVMLIREPVKGAGVSTDVSQASQPANAAGVDYFAGSYGGNFWNDFDYSAHRMPGSLAFLLSLPPASTNARFNGLDYLSNDNPVLLHTVPTTAPYSFPAGSFHPFAYSLGQTWNRFGHNSEISGPAPLNIPATPSIQNGLPREFSAATAPNFFVGRLTQEETSNAAFQYPQTMPAGGNPMNAAATTLTDADNDSVIDAFASGPRIGVDLLLANVHEFRVEIWDQRIGQFAPIGHSIGAGDYNLGRQINPTYLPLGGAAHIFDTWHPNFDRNFNIPSSGPPYVFDTADRPPFRALNWDPTVVAADPASPPGPTPSAPFRKGYWAPDTTYAVGDVVFPRTEDLNGNGILDAGENSTCGFTPPYGDVLFANQPDESKSMATLIPNRHPNLQFRPSGLTYAYRCIRGGHTLGSGPAGANIFEPNWSSRPGFVIVGLKEDLNNNGALNAGEPDFDGDGNAENEPDWVVEYNVRPVRAIRITVRFEHPQSKQMRQITIVHSLRDTTSVP